MDLKLAGKTALITGARRGSVARRPIRWRRKDAIWCWSRAAPATIAQAKISIARNANVSVETVPADLSDSQNVTRLAKDFPDIDILVNNAGAIPGGQLLDVDEATWRAAWDLRSSATSTCAGRSTR